MERGTEFKYYNGKVVLVDWMGSDLTVANAARVSFGKRSNSLDNKDIKLINYLAKHKHMSPFRHVQIQISLENIPEFVLRQLYKHNVGIGTTSDSFKEVASVWNEISGRYVELTDDYFQPDYFRPQSANNKQASENVQVASNEQATALYSQTMEELFRAYRKLLEIGVCREQARMVLPMSFLSSVIWTGSLEAFVNVVRLRKHAGAQLETQVLAKIIEEILYQIAPYSTKALLEPQ